jgi:hypothetical protein
MTYMNKLKVLAVVMLAAAGTLSCSSELTNNAAPVELVVTNTQNLSHIDLDPNNNDPDCNQELGTITMQIFPKNTSAGGNFVQVRVTRYRVTYRRTDGGTQVPSSFTRAIDTLIGVGTVAGSDFRIFEADAFNLAPFAALLPQNGGVDPDTHRPIIQLEVTLEVFGETLSGDKVSDSTSFPIEFCYTCNGCN